MTDFPPCPHCSDLEDGFYINSYWYGSIQRYYDNSGTHTDTNIDKLNAKTSNVVRCAGCLKIRKDVKITTDDTIVRSEVNGD